METEFESIEKSSSEPGVSKSPPKDEYPEKNHAGEETAVEKQNGEEVKE